MIGSWMPGQSPVNKLERELELDEKVVEICDAFEQRLKSGANVRVEHFLAQGDEVRAVELLQGLLVLELHYRHERGEVIEEQELFSRFPDARPLVESIWQPFRDAQPEFAETNAIANRSTSFSTDQPDQAQQFDRLPGTIDRYQLVRRLGSPGGFGVVGLYEDNQLGRPVAIKIPRRDRFTSQDAWEAFLEEAKAAAQLDKEGLVTIHDLGRTPEGQPYIVMEYVEGPDLAQWAESENPSSDRIVAMVSLVGEAIGYVHQCGIIHRDLKCENIRLDTERKPKVLDFGLSCHEADLSKLAGQVAGSPAYMSPEMTRGESHRIDGRSDLWSLGVIFYELLTGQRPFRANTVSQLFDEIQNREPKPLRMIRPSIPRELERICLKLLAKRMSERYGSATDLIEDLQHWSQQGEPKEVAASKVPASKVAVTKVAATPPTKTIDPRGLRSFEKGDAHFFLDLLPGPRDRDGLPESIRFWKRRIEEFDPEEAFPVGLIYGPTGCGKTSLVKAGLLPRLNKQVTSVYVEATPEDTELRLRNGLTKHVPYLQATDDLPRIVRKLREEGLSGGRKLLIVLDQFEQWLHANRDNYNTSLLRALRHCDGANVQCVAMVRDDFWLAARRFADELDLHFQDDVNANVIDLFSEQHARRVLLAFGRAYDRVTHELSGEQQEFVERAIKGLSRDGKVVSVQISLFADMMKEKLWKPATLKKVGGTEGIAVTFLEETFSTSTLRRSHLLHQEAARAVLNSLLPESGTEIKGHMRSHEELLEVSGYADRPGDFAELIGILDRQRLITPTDPEGIIHATYDESQVDDRRKKYYQLTHDYLVPHLREWLHLKQKETRRGRAELKLEDRAKAWESQPENRNLPSLWEFARIRLLTDKGMWTEPQQKMMRRAGRIHLFRLSVLALLVVVAFLWGRLVDIDKRELREKIAELKGRISALIRNINLDEERIEDLSDQSIDKLGEIDISLPPDLTILLAEVTQSCEEYLQLGGEPPYIVGQLFKIKRYSRDLLKDELRTLLENLRFEEEHINRQLDELLHLAEIQ